MSANGTLRLLREQLNLSMQEVADAAGISFRTVLRAEQGAPLNPESRRRLCTFYGKTSEELGLVPRRPRGKKKPLTGKCKRTRANIHS
jgi:transcriptional regulator with XRE-family HTH domain